MRRAAPVAATVLVLCVAALAVLSSLSGGRRGGAARDVALISEADGPKLVLHGVDVREFSPGGTAIRLRSERASYAILTRDLSAEDVTVAVPAPAGEIVLKAPLAYWSMDAGVVRLPGGGRGAGAGGWAATVPDARLDLSARELTASAASLSGPGVAVEGSNLVWRWKDGTMTMDAASGRVLPGKVAARHG